MDDTQADDTYDGALERIHHVFIDSSEVIAAFISCSRSNVVAPEVLVTEAGRVLAELEMYRAGIRAARTN